MIKFPANLNERGLARCKVFLQQATQFRAAVQTTDTGACVVDCGVNCAGGLEAGRALGEICLAGLGQVQFVPRSSEVWNGVAVSVATDQPIAACMASQYAGWPVEAENFFAMGSGPMRAARGREPLLEQLAIDESPQSVIGILESRKLPTAVVCHQIAEQCGVAEKDVTLLVAPTASIAGTVQVVARSVETALHKLFELGFDLHRVKSGFGVAPLPPVAGDDMAGIGRTNDAMLYGGEVTLWVTGDDESLEAIGPQVPSSASKDYGEPFAHIFKRYDFDFYKIDPLLFSPAVVSIVNLDSGRSWRFGKLNADVIHDSFTG